MKPANIILLVSVAFFILLSTFMHNWSSGIFLAQTTYNNFYKRAKCFIFKMSVFILNGFILFLCPQTALLLH